MFALNMSVRKDRIAKFEALADPREITIIDSSKLMIGGFCESRISFEEERQENFHQESNSSKTKKKTSKVEKSGQLEASKAPIKVGYETDNATEDEKVDGNCVRCR